MRTHSKLRGMLAVLVMLMSLAQAAPMAAAREMAEPAGNQAPDLYTYDLNAILADKSDEEAYDYLKLATALQGLANRETPQLFFFYKSGPLANEAGVDMDRYWFDKLRGSGEYLADYNIVEVADFWSLLDTFSDAYGGLVVWDPGVAATSNVASTIAGADSLLPVRYNPAADSLYNKLLGRGLNAEVNLVGKFTGSGIIADTAIPSTGSAKNDAYLWAKEKYLDTGKTNPTLMEYALDGSSWHSQLGENNAHVYAVHVPETLEAGKEANVSITFKNTGSTTWEKSAYFRLGAANTGAYAANAFFWSSATGGSFIHPHDQRVFMLDGEQVAPGQNKTFRFKIKAPDEPGKYVFAARMVRDGVAWMGDYVIKTIEVTAPATPLSLKSEKRVGMLTVPVNAAEIVSHTIPASIPAGEATAVSVTIKNNGSATWTKGGLYRLGSTWTEDYDDNQFVWSSESGGVFGNPSDQRVYMDDEDAIAPGEEKTFHFSLIAPEEEGGYTFWARLVQDGVAWIGDPLKLTVEVAGGLEPEPWPEETPVGDVYYPDLLGMLLPNADYFIANKAFFFDLSPDPLVTPNDDRGQPLGTDVNTLRTILAAQRAQAGDAVISIGGFVPWLVKYTDAVAPQPLMGMGAVEAEWAFVDIASQYGAQLDADVGMLGGLSNASVYSQVPMPASFAQANDKGAGNTEAFDRDKKYVVFYMSDFDSSGWMSGALPILWDDPARGDLPLAWSFATDLSRRVPHVFNYLYSTMTGNDYFVSGDNGTGYLNPMMLEGANVPPGGVSLLEEWEDYNTAAFERFDLDITGFLISGHSLSLSPGVQEAYSRISPAGVGTNGGYPERIVNGTPFTEVVTFGNEEKDAAAFGERLAGNLQSGGSPFRMFRILLTKPSVLAEAVDYVRTRYPGLEFEIVDPYTYFRLYKEAEAPSELRYDIKETEGPVLVDGNASPGEWDAAEPITVSKNAPAVLEHGTVWGSIASDAELSSSYRLQWDEDYMYIMEQRSSAGLDFSAQESEMYLSDATLLFLDLNGEKSGTALKAGDYVISMRAGGGPGNAPQLYMREGGASSVQEYELTAGQIASNIDGNTYVLEAAIPWSALQATPFVPAALAEGGMTLLASRGNGSLSAAWGQIMWSGDGDNQRKWGNFRLAGLPSEPEEPGSPGDEGGGGNSSGYRADEDTDEKSDIVRLRAEDVEIALEQLKPGEMLILDGGEWTDDNGEAGNGYKQYRLDAELVARLAARQIGLSFQIGKWQFAVAPSAWPELPNSAAGGGLSANWVLDFWKEPMERVSEPGQMSTVGNRFGYKASVDFGEKAEQPDSLALRRQTVKLAGEWTVTGITDWIGSGEETKIWAQRRSANGGVSPVPARLNVNKDGSATLEMKSWSPGSYAFVRSENGGSTGFRDVDGHWAARAIGYLEGRSIVLGAGNGRFQPIDVITRAAFMQMLVKAAGLWSEETGSSARFRDVDNSAWYAPAVEQGMAYGIVGGIAEGLFKPQAVLTRSMAFQMVGEAARLLGLSAEQASDGQAIKQFADVAMLPGWASANTALLIELDIVRGDRGKLKPLAAITRAEAAAIVERLLHAAGY